MQDGYKEADDFYKNKSSEFEDQLTAIQNDLQSLQGGATASASVIPPRM